MWIRIPCCEAMSVIFEVYRIKRSGPRMEPCGTPKRMLQTLDVLVLTRTECVLSVRNETIHLSAEAVKPNFNSRTCKRMEGSTQSKVALKSKRKRAVLIPVSRAVTMSLYTFTTAVSVEWVTKEILNLIRCDFIYQSDKHGKHNWLFTTCEQRKKSKRNQGTCAGSEYDMNEDDNSNLKRKQTTYYWRLMNSCFNWFLKTWCNVTR